VDLASILRRDFGVHPEGTVDAEVDVEREVGEAEAERFGRFGENEVERGRERYLGIDGIGGTRRMMKRCVL